MAKRSLSGLLAPAIALLCLLVPSAVMARLNLPEAEGTVTIGGEDNVTVRDFFARYGEGASEREPSGGVGQILVGVLPRGYREGCREMIARWGPEAVGTEAMSVTVLHVETRRDEKPIRALLSYSCFSTSPRYPKYRDERLASLVVGRRASRLEMMPDARDREDSPVLTRIKAEKDIHIRGKGVVGLAFARTNENPCCTTSAPAGEEWVNFYLMDDEAVRRAGSVLTGEKSDGPDGVKTVYSAAVIFKKDMKGNIIGILAPYTVTKDARRVGKGMERYDWDEARRVFVKE